MNDTQMTKRIGDVVLTGVIGKGAFSEVHKGLMMQRGRETAVAVKIVPKSNVNTKIVESEVAILKQISHPNVVNFIDKITTNNNVYIITELCTRGNFREFVKKHYDGGRVPEAHVKKYLKQLLAGLAEIHKRNVVHRDLKQDNIFITEDYVIKIGDFGFAKFAGEDELLTSYKGTPVNMAPEVFHTFSKTVDSYNSKCDIWSLGTVCYELLFGRTVDNVKTARDLHLFINSDSEIALPADPALSPDCRDILLSMLRKKPALRPTAAVLLNHPFLADTSDSLIHTSLLIKSFFVVPGSETMVLDRQFFAASRLELFIALAIKNQLTATLAELARQLRSKLAILTSLLDRLHKVKGQEELAALLVARGLALVEKFSNVGFASERQARINAFLKRLIDAQSQQLDILGLYRGLQERAVELRRPTEEVPSEEILFQLHLKYFELVEANLKNEFALSDLDDPEEINQIRELEEIALTLAEFITFDFGGIAYELEFSKEPVGLSFDATDIAVYLDRVETVEPDDFTELAHRQLKPLFNFALHIEYLENYPSEKMAKNFEIFQSYLKEKIERAKNQN